LIPASLLAVALLPEAVLRLVNFNPFGEIIESDGRAIFLQPSANLERIYELVPRASGWGTEITVSNLGWTDILTHIFLHSVNRNCSGAYHVSAFYWHP